MFDVKKTQKNWNNARGRNKNEIKRDEEEEDTLRRAGTL